MRDILKAAQVESLERKPIAGNYSIVLNKIAHWAFF